MHSLKHNKSFVFLLSITECEMSVWKLCSCNLCTSTLILSKVIFSVFLSTIYAYAKISDSTLDQFTFSILVYFNKDHEFVFHKTQN